MPSKLNPDGTTASDWDAQLAGRNSKPIQTHNAVSIPLSGSAISTWIDTFGFDRLAITLRNDAATSSRLDINWSNDGVTVHGQDKDVLPANTSQTRSAVVDSKARYAQSVVRNDDSAVAHTMSSWFYLKT